MIQRDASPRSADKAGVASLWRYTELTCNVVFMDGRGLDVLYDIAEAQGGYFTTRQAAEASISTRLLTHYAGAGDLERVAHGVYRLVRYPSHRFGDMIAACLWAGDDSAVSHDSALAVYGLGDAMPAVIHLTLPRRFRGSRPGVIVHHLPLDSAEATVWEDVPVTTVERSIVDVATSVDPTLAAAATRDAYNHGFTSRDRLAAYVDQRPDRVELRRALPLSRPGRKAV